MTILDLVFNAYNIIGTGFSIIGGINHAIKKSLQNYCRGAFQKVFC